MPSASEPVRPHLPPVLVLAIGLWTGCAVVYGLCAGAGRGSLWVMGGFAVASFGSAVWYSHKTRAVVCLFLGVCLGGMCGAGGSFAYDARVQALDGATGTLTLRVVEDTRVSRWSSSVVCRITAVDGKRLFPAPKVAVNADDDSLFFGQTFVARAALSAPKQTSSYYRGQSIVAVCRIVEASTPVFEGLTRPVCSLRADTVRVMESLAEEGDAAVAVLEALVCGYRTHLTGSEVYENFKLAGVGHLVAVSGAHLSVMFGLISLGLRATRLSRRMRSVLQIGELLAYLVFSAIPLSALRAAVMVGLGLMSFFSERRASVLNALGFCIIAVIVINPANALSASFLLSASSTLGIVLFAGLGCHWLGEMLPFLPRAVNDAMALTLSATMLSLPFGIALFSQCSLVTLPANLVCAPLFTLACTIGMGAAAVHAVLPGLGLLLMKVALAVCSVLCEAVRFLAHLPYACVPASLGMVAATLITLALGFIIWILWPKPSAKGVGMVVGATAIAVLTCAFAFAGGTRIVMLDVGQGDAILVQSGGRSMLVDTGNQESLLKKALSRSHIAHLDGVVISHPDDDHCGALTALSGVCEIDAVYVASDLLACGCDNCAALRQVCNEADLTMVGLRVGDGFDFGSFAMRVLWPHSYVVAGDNADSLCLLLTEDFEGDGAADWLMLFTGDAGISELQQMIANGAVGDIDALKVGHHGSATALDVTCAGILQPELALISVGVQNRYGHPTQAVLEVLEGCGAETYRTDRDGDISLIFSSKGVRVRTQR